MFNHPTVSAAANAATCAPIVVRVGSVFLRPAVWYGSEENLGPGEGFFLFLAYHQVACGSKEGGLDQEEGDVLNQGGAMALFTDTLSTPFRKRFKSHFSK